MAKTYVCSDVHSHLNVFEQALDYIGADAKLYIIGDVIDKGPDGIKVLQKVMKDPRCELLMGNHDMMFLQYLYCKKEFHPDTYEFREIEYNWVMNNGGRATLRDYKKLSENEKMEIYKYLENLPLLKMITINNRDFILVHASCQNIELENLKEINTQDLISKNGGYDWTNNLIWGREETHIPGKITITGHTYVQYLGHNDIIVSDDGLWYDIDCGLARRSTKSRLALLCLDDLECHYFNPPEYAEVQ